LTSDFDLNGQCNGLNIKKEVLIKIGVGRGIAGLLREQLRNK